MKVNFSDKKDQIGKYFEENLKDDLERDVADNSLFHISDNELTFYFDEGDCTIDENFKVEMPLTYKICTNRPEPVDSGTVISIAELIKFLCELFKEKDSK